MNVITFSGHLGKDCRTNTVGQSFVANFSVPMTEGYGEKKKTHWVECALWGKQAESLAPYLLKGQGVVISGEAGMKPASEKYEAQITCRVEHITLMGKRVDAQESRPAQQASAPAGASSFAGDDVPFMRHTSNYGF